MTNKEYQDFYVDIQRNKNHIKELEGEIFRFKADYLANKVYITKYLYNQIISSLNATLDQLKRQLVFWEGLLQQARQYGLSKY